MNKKILAAAVAGAFIAPAAAFAQSASTVQVFGTIYVNYGEHKYTPNTTTRPSIGNRYNTDIMSIHDTEIGFKGEEKLGGGLSAWFQCASNFDVVKGNAQFASATTTTSWCNRNSGIGFKGDFFGNVFFGNWDTPYKLASSTWRVHGTTGIWGISSFMYGAAPQGGTTDAVAATGGVNQNRNTAFRRQQQQISWHSPTWAGFQVMASTAASGGNITGLSSGATGGKPRLWSLAGTWTSGPFYVGAAYEQHKDFSGNFVPPGVGAITAIEGKDKFWTVNGAYTYGPFKIGLAYEHRKFEQPPNAVGGNKTDLSSHSWGAHGQWNIAGPHSVKAVYAKADDVKGSSNTPLAPYNAPICAAVGGTCAAIGQARGDTGGYFWGLIYNYAFSKRTAVDLGYSYAKNDQNGTYAGNGFPGTTGSKLKVWGLGIRHTF